MSKTKKFEDFNNEKVNENLQDITNEVNGISIYGDGNLLPLKLANMGDVKKWVIENQMGFNEIMVIDESGDSVTISKEDTLEDIELLFSDIENVEMEEDCGCTSGVREYEEYEEEVEENDDFPINDLAPKFDTVVENEEEYEEESTKEYEEKSIIEEYEEKVNKRFNVIQRRVNEINEMISKAIDKDGDKLLVVDPKSTWEEPMSYEPIAFENNILTIRYTEPYNKNKDNIEKIDLNVYLEDIDENHFILEDAKGDLSSIKRMYNKAIKKAKKDGNLAEETSNNKYSRNMVANELGIDSDEFDDSSDLGMLADRIGERKTTLKFQDYFKK